MINHVEGSTELSTERVEGLPSSEEQTMLSMVVSRAVSVEWYCLLADWS
jgi:hypothetical protein